MFARFAKTAPVPCLLAARALVNAAPAAAQEAGEVTVTFSGIAAHKGAASSLCLHNHPGAAYRCRS